MLHVVWTSKIPSKTSKSKFPGLYFPLRKQNDQNNDFLKCKWLMVVVSFLGNRDLFRLLSKVGSNSQSPRTSNEPVDLLDHYRCFFKATPCESNRIISPICLRQELQPIVETKPLYTGGILLPTQTMHYYKGHPLKHLYICSVWSTQNGWHLVVIPAYNNLQHFFLLRLAMDLPHVFGACIRSKTGLLKKPARMCWRRSEVRSKKTHEQWKQDPDMTFHEIVVGNWGFLSWFVIIPI